MMKTEGMLTRVLAVAGTALVWSPILATVVISVFGSIRARVFRFDYLMPAELFPAMLVGGGLLMWAALRSRLRRGLIGWGLGVAVGLLVGGQVLAVATGLASGETEPVGWPWMLVVASIILYWLALLEIGTAGVLLVRDLFRQGKDRSSSPEEGDISKEKLNKSNRSSNIR